MFVLLVQPHRSAVCDFPTAGIDDEAPKPDGLEMPNRWAFAAQSFNGSLVRVPQSLCGTSFASSICAMKQIQFSAPNFNLKDLPPDKGKPRVIGGRKAMGQVTSLIARLPKGESHHTPGMGIFLQNKRDPHAPSHTTPRP